MESDREYNTSENFKTKSATSFQMSIHKPTGSSPARTAAELDRRLPSSNSAQDASHSYYTPPLTVGQGRTINHKLKVLDQRLQSETPSRVNQTLSSSPLPEAGLNTSKDFDLVFQAPISPRPSTPTQGAPWRSSTTSSPIAEHSPTTVKYLNVDADTPVFSEEDLARSEASSCNGKTPTRRIGRVKETPPKAPKFDSWMLQYGIGPVIEDQSSPTTHTKAAARRRKLQEQQLNLQQMIKPDVTPESSPPKSIASQQPTRDSPTSSPLCAVEEDDESDENVEEPEMNEEVGKIAQLENENAALKTRISRLEKRMNSVVKILSQVVDQCDTFDKHLGGVIAESDNDQANEEEIDTDHDESDEWAETDIENQDPELPMPPVRRIKSESYSSSHQISSSKPFSSPDKSQWSSPSPSCKRRATSLELSMNESMRLQKKLRLHVDDIYHEK